MHSWTLLILIIKTLGMAHPYYFSSRFSFLVEKLVVKFRKLFRGLHIYMKYILMKQCLRQTGPDNYERLDFSTRSGFLYFAVHPLE